MVGHEHENGFVHLGIDVGVPSKTGGARHLTQVARILMRQ